MIIWTPAVLSALYACALYFCIGTCSAQLSMFHIRSLLLLLCFPDLFVFLSVFFFVLLFLFLVLLSEFDCSYNSRLFKTHRFYLCRLP